MLRLLIADDSAFFREVLREVVAAFPDVEVVGEAADGEQAVELCCALAPDVVTMDVIMPLVGGIGAIRSIMARRPTAVVVLSRVAAGDERVALDAMAAGALEVFGKPAHGFDDATAVRLVALLRAAAAAGPHRARPHAHPKPSLPARAAPRVAGLVASTGGPQLLREVLAALPRDFPLPIAIVQHTASGFGAALASWLDDASALPVAIAEHGRALAPGRVVLAPDDRHLEIGEGGAVRVKRGPPVAGHRPSGTVLLESLARSYGSAALGVVLTGMGSDGAHGLAAIARAGGVAVVEDPDTAEVDRMPRSALAAAGEALIAAGDELADLLVSAARGVVRGAPPPGSPA
jgi:two-component system chemotaxis response regulator CheB